MTEEVFSDVCGDTYTNVGKILKHKNRYSIIGTGRPYTVDRDLGLRACLIMCELIITKLKDTVGRYQAPHVYYHSSLVLCNNEKVLCFIFGEYPKNKPEKRKLNHIEIENIGNDIVNELCEAQKNVINVLPFKEDSSVEFFFPL